MNTVFCLRIFIPFAFSPNYYGAFNLKLATVSFLRILPPLLLNLTVHCHSVTLSGSPTLVVILRVIGYNPEDNRTRICLLPLARSFLLLNLSHVYWRSTSFLRTFSHSSSISFTYRDCNICFNYNLHEI